MGIQKHHTVILLICFLSLGIAVGSGPDDKGSRITIQWVGDLKGDFDFRSQWDYPEGVYRNEFGQLGCDGLCPEGLESMKDSTGKIFPDSLAAFYRLVDTTHQMHSISCEAWCYEWGGTDYITAKQIETGAVLCSTQMNAGTHCRLIFKISRNACFPRIELLSVARPGTKAYYCKGGWIKIDKNHWSRGILKAEVSFDFNNTDEPGKKIFWKGRIYAKIERM
jgi:hypothetical protein